MGDMGFALQEPERAKKVGVQTAHMSSDKAMKDPRMVMTPPRAVRCSNDGRGHFQHSLCTRC